MNVTQTQELSAIDFINISIVDRIYVVYVLYVSAKCHSNACVSVKRKRFNKL